MKRFSIILLAVLVLILGLTIMPAEAQGFKALGSLIGGIGLQKGVDADFMYAGGFDVPVVTRESNYQILTEVTYLYSDRTIDEVSEVEAMRTVVSGRKFIDSSAFYIGLGGGAWNTLNTGGENKTLPMFNANFGIMAAGFDFHLGCDFVRMAGPDIYFLNLGVRIINL